MFSLRHNVCVNTKLPEPNGLIGLVSSSHLHPGGGGGGGGEGQFASLLTAPHPLSVLIPVPQSMVFWIQIQIHVSNADPNRDS